VLRTDLNTVLHHAAVVYLTRAMRAKDAIAAAWIATQFLVPLQYYTVRWYDDPNNEMYAWRMFSDVHHGASYVEWFWWADESSKAVPVGNMTKAVGVSVRWQQFVTGLRPSHQKAPPVWVMERTANFLCKELHAHAISAMRTQAPWHGEIEEREFGWKC
jgi:hypothetical protein